jgi:hypothetical protein
MAQAWEPPALTVANVPAGGVDSPSPFEPQQAIVLSVRKPHEKAKPALTALKVPVGASV